MVWYGPPVPVLVFLPIRFLHVHVHTYTYTARFFIYQGDWGRPRGIFYIFSIRFVHVHVHTYTYNHFFIIFIATIHMVHVMTVRHGLVWSSRSCLGIFCESQIPSFSYERDLINSKRYEIIYIILDIHDEYIIAICFFEKFRNSNNSIDLPAPVNQTKWYTPSPATVNQTKLYPPPGSVATPNYRTKD